MIPFLPPSNPSRNNWRMPVVSISSCSRRQPLYTNIEYDNLWNVSCEKSNLDESRPWMHIYLSAAKIWPPCPWERMRVVFDVLVDIASYLVYCCIKSLEVILYRYKSTQPHYKTMTTIAIIWTTMAITRTMTRSNKRGNWSKQNAPSSIQRWVAIRSVLFRLVHELVWDSLDWCRFTQVLNMLVFELFLRLRTGYVTWLLATRPRPPRGNEWKWKPTQTWRRCPTLSFRTRMGWPTIEFTKMWRKGISKVTWKSCTAKPSIWR